MNISDLPSLNYQKAIGSKQRLNLEARVGIEPTMAELQSTALPLCYRALTSSFVSQTRRGAILGNISNKSTTYLPYRSFVALLA